MTEELRLAESDRAQILVTARLLEATATLDWLSTGMTLIAFASLVVGGAGLRDWIPPMTMIVLGLVAKFFAVRISLDARLLRDIASERMATASLDDALVALKLARPEKTGRDWTARCRGAKRLSLFLAAATVGQCVAVLAMISN